jgi:hypothetical protein
LDGWKIRQRFVTAEELGSGDGRIRAIRISQTPVIR